MISEDNQWLFEPSEFKKPPKEWTVDEISEYNRAIVRLTELSDELLSILISSETNGNDTGNN